MLPVLFTQDARTGICFKHLDCGRICIGTISQGTESADINARQLTLHPGMVLYSIGKPAGGRAAVVRGMDYHDVLNTIRGYGRPMVLTFAETVADVHLREPVAHDFVFGEEGQLGIEWRHSAGARPRISGIKANTQAARYAGKARDVRFETLRQGMALSAVQAKGKVIKVEGMTFMKILQLFKHAGRPMTLTFINDCHAEYHHMDKMLPTPEHAAMPTLKPPSLGGDGARQAPQLPGQPAALKPPSLPTANRGGVAAVQDGAGGAAGSKYSALLRRLPAFDAAKHSREEAVEFIGFLKSGDVDAEDMNTSLDEAGIDKSGLSNQELLDMLLLWFDQYANPLPAVAPGKYQQKDAQDNIAYLPSLGMSDLQSVCADDRIQVAQNTTEDDLRRILERHFSRYCGLNKGA